MNLVLERLADKTTPVDVIVTADTRGNYIEHMIKRCGGNALRVPDGYKAFGALKNIVRDSYEKAHSIAVALDGPLGCPQARAATGAEKTGILLVGTCRRSICRHQPFLFFMYQADSQMG